MAGFFVKQVLNAILYKCILRCLMQISDIVKNFKFKGDFYCFKLIKTGNINKTYLVEFRYGRKITRYVLQKINTHVFKDPVKLMQNSVAISNHIKSKKHATIVSIDYLPCYDGNFYFVDDLNNYWRAYNYIDHAVCFDTTANLFVINEAGSAFGEFQNLLCDFNPSDLHETIEDFHNTEKYFEKLKASARADAVGRVKFAVEELDYLCDVAERFAEYVGDINNLNLPLRVVHNDTKCNNVLFDEKTLKCIAVIDLDTVMQGIVCNDFGDGARSIASSANENETNPDKIDFDLKKFEAFTKGYLLKTNVFLTVDEVSSFYLAPFLMAIELSARFLKDYLDGDLYFKTETSEHNLKRCRNQIILSKKILSKQNDIRQIVNKFFDKKIYAAD